MPNKRGSEGPGFWYNQAVLSSCLMGVVLRHPDFPEAEVSISHRDGPPGELAQEAPVLFISACPWRHL